MQLVPILICLTGVIRVKIKFYVDVNTARHGPKLLYFSVSFYPFGVEGLKQQHSGFQRLSVIKAAGWTAGKHQGSNLQTRASRKLTTG